MSEALLQSTPGPANLVSETGARESVHNAEAWRGAFYQCRADQDALIAAVRGQGDLIEAQE